MNEQNKNTNNRASSKAKSRYGKGVLIMLCAVFTAIAVALGFIFGLDYSRSSSLDSAQGGEVTRSATNRNPSLSGATVNDYSTTALVNGDTFTMTGTNNYYTIKLPIGKYNLEVWGAQGGVGYTATILGGYGGYAKATYTITAVTTLYVYVGGYVAAGSNAAKGTTTAGGYNGGGSTTYNRTPSSCKHYSGPGGGATHIATSSGLLSAVTAANILIVGGGGGGGGYNGTTNTGGSGGPTGGNGGTYSSYTNYAAGGTTTAGGSCVAGSNSYSSFAAGSAGTKGKGGNGGTGTNGPGGGGGGGGYYGGAGGYTTTSSCYSTAGGGGSNYIKSGLTVLANQTQSSWTGNGKAVITVVNQSPTSLNYTATLGTRLAGTSTTISASNLAKDPDGTATAVYFSNGTSGAYDTYSNFTTNSGLYLDSACSVSANRYFSWTTSTNVSFTIKAIKYPRAGQTGVTATSTTGNTVTLYTKIRDAYGSVSGSRGCSTISFTLKVPRETLTQPTSGNATVVSSTGATSSVGYLIGNSAATTAPTDPTTVAAGTIYNPNGTGVKTLFIKKKLTPGEKITISAANLYSGFSTSYDMPVIALTDLTKISGSGRLFKVTEVDAGTNKVTALSTAFGTIANTYSQISLECVAPQPGYQSLPVTVYLVEKSACNNGTTVSNAALWDSVTSTAYSFQIVFIMENTRPTFRSGVSNLVDITTGQSTSLSLNTYFIDSDVSAITTSTHTITDVIVPKKEFVLINGKMLVDAAPNYNVGYTTGQQVTDSAFTTTATGNTDTGFKDNIAYNEVSPGTVSKNEAFMSYTYSGITLTVTGLHSSFSQYNPGRSVTALGHFYLLLHISDKSNTLDNGIWLPIAFTVGGTQATTHTPLATVTSSSRFTVSSQTAVNQFPSAAGDVGKSFYFAPMAINYGGSHIIGQYKAEDGEGNNTGALTQTDLQALGMDADNFATTNGLASWNGNKINELLTITSTPEQVVKSIYTSTAVAAAECSASNGVWSNQYFKAENFDLYIQKSMIADSTYSGGRIVNSTGTAPAGTGYQYINFGTAQNINDVDYYVIKGLKITLKSATMNRYIYPQVTVADATGYASPAIKIAVKVNNTAPVAYTTTNGKSANVATFGNSESTRDNSYSLYEYDGAAGSTPTFTYKIPLGSTVVVTPYDFVSDYDMSVYGVTGVQGGFTLNGYNGVYEAGKITTGSTNITNIQTQRIVQGTFRNGASTHNANATAFLSSLKMPATITGVSSTADGTAANTAINANADVLRDRLFFQRSSDTGVDAFVYNPSTYNDIVCSQSNTTNFFDVNFGTKVNIGNSEFSVDYVLISALARTTQPAAVQLTVRDRYGSKLIPVTVYIEVVNAKPVVKDDAYYTEISVKPISDQGTVVTPDTVEVAASGNGTDSGVMIDSDGDTPEFMMSRGVAIVNKLFVDQYNSNTMTDDGNTPFDMLEREDFENLPKKYTSINGIDLTNYITAEVTSKRYITVKAVSSTKVLADGVYIAFFATDNNGGVVIGYARIEVLNTAPELNVSEIDGFDSDSKLWNIVSASDADITRDRYIVGSSEAAEKIIDMDPAVLDISVKLIAVDDDGMHNKTVLSQVTATTSAVTGASEYNFINLDRSNVNKDALKAAIPNVEDGVAFGDKPAAVTLFRTSSSQKIAGAPNRFTAEFFFFVDGEWYDRERLISALDDTEGGATLELDSCFDSYGRFTVADWALRLRATEGFSANINLGINLSLRDQAELGGSTAGLATAYNSNRSIASRVIVDGHLVTTVYEHISKTGIRSVNEYLGVYNNYYTVESPVKNARNEYDKYVSTYDGNINSTFEADNSEFTGKSLYYNNLDISSSGTLIKDRSAGQADKTLAGVNSGVVYDAKSTTAIKGAFTYSDTIEVPAAIRADSKDIAVGNDAISYESVYVPMSYFGLLSTLATPDDDGVVIYPSSTFVGYNIPNGKAIDRSNIQLIAKAITLSDGTNEWTGKDINNNPYVKIDTFDWNNLSSEERSGKIVSGNREYIYSQAYYNNRLAVATVSPQDKLTGFQKSSANFNSFVGDGRIMYLENQASELLEHNFGLIFTKKAVRTGARSLSLRINLARYDDDEIVVNDEGEVEEADSCTAEVKIHIENTPFDLYDAETGTGDKYSLRYDAEKGTYYVDLTMTSSDSAVFNLARKQSSESAPKTGNPISGNGIIEYYDDDYGTAEKRDYVYFYSDSFSQLNRWQTGDAGYTHAMEVSDDKFANVVYKADQKAQKSAANYFGVKYDAAGLASLSSGSYHDGTYQANSGKEGYGTAGRDGYSGYFSASVTNSGAKLSITAIRKTVINDIVFSSNPTREEIAAAYSARGLVAEFQYSDGTMLKRAYYPFKVLVYDSYGTSFTEGAYTAVEFRIQITNSSPELKQVGEATDDGRELSINLAVGNSTVINLYDIVSDSDIYTYTNSNGVSWLATQNSFEHGQGVSDLSRDSGDYLKSPLETNKDLSFNNSQQPGKDNDGVYFYNGGGFVTYGGSDFNTRDVVMWMDTDDQGDPIENAIVFKVNRRTIAKLNGNAVSINRYKFTLKFQDGQGEETAPITFNINITNQTPSITQINRSFTMQMGDDLTVLTSYYDTFTDNMSDAYTNSDTYKNLTDWQNGLNYGNAYGDGQNNSTGFSNYWKFADITSAKAGGNKVITDSVTNRTEDFNGFLGYVGLATDDTPWRLRITDCSNKSNGKIAVRSDDELALLPEGSSNSVKQQIALNIRANGACVNEPITLTISDGEEGVIACTLYFTVVSSKPEARDPSIKEDNAALAAAGLTGVKYNPPDEYIYRTFIVPAAGKDGYKFDVEGIGEVTAVKEREIFMRDVAKDSDGDTETQYMSLYGNGDFTLNDQPLVRGSDGIYHSDYFDLTITNSGRSILITATGYNAETQDGYEKLTFRIADYGDSSFENTIVITLQIYTLYSDMTNPTAAGYKAGDDYNKYLAGSEIVSVKEYDTYFDPTKLVDKSKYAFVSLIGNSGNDGNTLSPIVDPDATKLGDTTYNTKLYAFVDFTGDGVNTPFDVTSSLSASELDKMFTRDAGKKTFLLKSDVNVSDYLIGGVGDGVSLSADGTTRLSAVSKYATFEFADDGTSVQIVPQAATTGKTIMLYIEVEKNLGNRSAALRENATLKAGSLFKLNVRDSKPQQVGGNQSVSGVKGSTVELKVFDASDKYGALFMDSDYGDVVTLFGLDADNKLKESEYANVMSVADEKMKGLDWKADAKSGKPRAFDIYVNDQGKLVIKINRRVDYIVDGVYQTSVTIPLKITGVDKAGESTSTIVNLTISNTDFTANEYYSKTDEISQVGYTFNQTLEEGYVVNVSLRYGEGYSLDVNFADLLVDKDSLNEKGEKEKYDADSFRFVSPKTTVIGGYNYLTDSRLNVDWYALDADGNPNVDYTETLAIAEPLGEDEFHRTGIRFTAVATKRDLVATIYVRVIDRAGNAEVAENGLVIKFNVIVMNDAPYIIDGMETTTLYMVGSESKDPEGMLFYIGDFVADRNDSDVVGDDASAKNPDTYLRISLQESRETDKIYSRTYETIPESMGFSDLVLSSVLFEVIIPNSLDENMLADYRTRMNKGDDFEKDTSNRYNQWFVVKPRKGFYGEGAIDIMVVDGNANVKYDTLSATFSINVHVISNADEVIDKLNDVEIACSKSVQLDIRSLMPDLENKLTLTQQDNSDGNDGDTGAGSDEQGVQTSAAEDANMFSQYEYYVITGISFQNEMDANKATFTKLDEAGQLWELKAGNQVTRDPVRVEVRFALKTDSTKTYKKYFYLNVIANRAPNIKRTSIEFKRYGTEEAGDDLDFNLSESNTVRLEAWQLCYDEDDPEGTAIRFVDVKSQVSSIVKAKLIKDENGEYRWLELTFASRGESEITITVTDETGMPIQLKFKAVNKDLPEASMWVKLAASFESNPVMWILIICSVLLLLIVLIIIIAVLRKRKREKEELEALLVSEMEIEEQMLRLAGGPSPTDFQSFGYLAGAGAAQPDPSMMLGAGADAPQEQLTALPPAPGEPSNPTAQGDSSVPPAGDAPNGGGDMPM